MKSIPPDLHGSSYIHEIILEPGAGNGLHIGNVEFIQFFDDARQAYLPSVGCPVYDKATGLGQMVVSNHCDYLAELTAPDKVLVGVNVLNVGKHTIKLGMRVFSTKQRCMVAEGYTVAITYNFHDNRKVPVPDNVRDKISM